MKFSGVRQVEGRMNGMRFIMESLLVTVTVGLTDILILQECFPISKELIVMKWSLHT